MEMKQVLFPAELWEKITERAGDEGASKYIRRIMASHISKLELDEKIPEPVSVMESFDLATAKEIERDIEAKKDKTRSDLNELIRQEKERIKADKVLEELTNQTKQKGENETNGKQPNEQPTTA